MQVPEYCQPDLRKLGRVALGGRIGLPAAGRIVAYGYTRDCISVTMLR
jgi:hypothetical protein